MIPLMPFLKKLVIACGFPVFDWNPAHKPSHDHVKLEELAKLIDFRFVETDRSIGQNYTTLYIHRGTGRLYYRMKHFSPGATYRWNFEFSEHSMRIAKIHKGREPYLLIDYKP